MSLVIEDGGPVMMSLPILQDAIKRQSGAYESDFRAQYVSLKSRIEQFETSPQKADKEFHELVMFCAQVGYLYDGVVDELSRTMLRLLLTYHQLARPGHLKTILGALCLLDNNDHIDRKILFNGWLELLQLEHDLIPSIVMKQFTKTLGRITSDQDKKLWQGKLFQMMGTNKKSTSHDITTTGHNLTGHNLTTTSLFRRRLQFILISLFVKRIWEDKRTANTIANGVFDSCPKVVENAARFLLGDIKRLNVYHAENKQDQEVEPEEARRKTAELIAGISRELCHNNKTGKNLKKMEKMKEAAEKEMSKLETKVDLNSTLPFVVLQHVYDPHLFALRVFTRATSKSFTTGDGRISRLSFRLKLQLLTICSRLIGTHGIYIPGFFTFCHPYLKPTQEKITGLMAIISQAVNKVTPPEELQQTTRLIANMFAIESCANEVITVGINSIREMCSRNTLAITSELLTDLITMGKESKNSSVRIAAKSLRNLYRQNNPSMLPRKDRVHAGSDLKLHNGKDENQPTSMIEGLDILVGLKQAWHNQNHQHMTEDDQAHVQRVLDIQKSKVLSNRDFQALRRIKIKMLAAQSVGYSLRQWLDSNDGAWEQLAEDILGLKPGQDDNLQDDDLQDDDLQDDDLQDDDLQDDDLQDDNLDDDKKEEEDESDDKDQSDDEIKDDETDTHETGSGSESGTESDLFADEDGMALDDDDDDSSGERERFILGSDLGNLKVLSKERKRELVRAGKIEEKQKRRAQRHGGKETNRAGITNRSQARNKPMAMLRQKQSIREKRVASAKDKVSNLKNHIKTLKTSIRQKFRRK
ncbi:putative SDA1-like protein [Gregarina niphandrodes]|uniref:Protein SDA1 n=1 Tax=Gregarina niphandrodes TaxID=110365 RepID=A0A023BA84_GRENI|nr:putative SDA1-like protein [Gregarina niphandrodes]EZG77893.1 putative SDA1-like protein [Gregarina niphandrodes]|eukprot:XP_011129470.1 putative SDA1-like protein [Gregarina niphandrodes]